jgi:3-oxoacyl-[acyl-carrier-protein] synthase II
MSEKRALQEKREPLGSIVGWGMSDDADHMTRPSSESGGRALAISKAISYGGIEKNSIGLISAHGTGTIYNDAMEIKAFRAIFDYETPVYSIKGAIGHTMGAAGLVETIIALRALRECIVPPTINLRECEENAEGWVSPESRRIDKGKMALITNAGFGGINAALILS